jgi:hypothetical protein
MAAPLMRRRLRRPAQESIDDLAQMEQITEPAEIVGNVGICAGGRRSRRLVCVPISPRGRNERAGAVRQDHENETHATASNAVNYRKRAALKRVTLARYNHRLWEILEMGSLSYFPSKM